VRAVLPTGCGKTVVFASVAEKMRPQRRTLVFAHREELIRQACDRIQAWTALGGSRWAPSEGLHNSQLRSTRCLHMAPACYGLSLSRSNVPSKGNLLFLSGSHTTSPCPAVGELRRLESNSRE
jgi:hypothetical protein